MQARKFTRYPTDKSISFVIDNMLGEHQIYLKDASQGGLCFNAQGCIQLGTHLHITMPVSSEKHCTKGKVSWCHPSDNGQCQLGIEFEERLNLSTIEKIVLRH
ncbi:MAG: PilZ domain-containing protein [Gammaproteobacteria bacterium]|nr:PilZ domain-containing protein [Gammaproteobacteria bacterium]